MSSVFLSYHPKAIKVFSSRDSSSTVCGFLCFRSFVSLTSEFIQGMRPPSGDCFTSTNTYQEHFRPEDHAFLFLRTLCFTALHFRPIISLRTDGIIHPESSDSSLRTHSTRSQPPSRPISSSDSAFSTRHSSQALSEVIRPKTVFRSHPSEAPLLKSSSRSILTLSLL
jgi:hypothetical protein